MRYVVSFADIRFFLHTFRILVICLHYSTPYDRHVIVSTHFCGLDIAQHFVARKRIVLQNILWKIVLIILLDNKLKCTIRFFSVFAH